MVLPSVAKSGSSGKKRKHSADEADSAPRSKRVINEKKIQEIEDIVTQLKEKHGSKYKVKHLNAWAHLGKHSSLDTPPNYPYFVGRKSAKTSASKDTESQSDPPTSSAKANPGTLSPGKRVHLRSECIDQLSRWHSLKESGGITSEEYDEETLENFD